jgi:hypothetical protein
MTQRTHRLTDELIWVGLGNLRFLQVNSSLKLWQGEEFAGKITVGHKKKMAVVATVHFSKYVYLY